MERKWSCPKAGSGVHPEVAPQPVQQVLVFVALLRLLGLLLHLVGGVFSEGHRARPAVEGVVGVHGLAPGALPRFECDGPGRFVAGHKARLLQHFLLDVAAGEVDVDLGHGGVPLPPGDDAQLHLGKALLRKVGEAGVAEGVGVDGFGDAGPAGDGLEGVLDGCYGQPFCPDTVAVIGREEGGVGVVSQGVLVDPGLEFGGGGDETDASPPGLAVHDDHGTVAVELDVPDVEGDDLADAGAGVPHQHQEGAVAGSVADVDEFLDVGAGKKAVGREFGDVAVHLDVLEEVGLDVFAGEPPDEESQFEDLAVDGDGAAGLPSPDEVVLDVVLGDGDGVFEVDGLEEGISAPEFCLDGAGGEVV